MNTDKTGASLYNKVIDSSKCLFWFFLGVFFFIGVMACFTWALNIHGI